MDQHSKYDLIEDYLRNRLPKAKHRALEAEIQSDPELAEQVQKQRQEHQMMELLLEDGLRDKLNAWDKTPPPKIPSFFSPQLIFLTLLIIAVLLLLFVLLESRQADNNSPLPPVENIKSDLPVANEEQLKTPEEEIQNPPEQTPDHSENPSENSNSTRYIALAIEYQEAISFTDGFQRSGQEGEDEFEQALMQLQDKKYTEGITFLSNITTTDPRFQDAQYYQALAYYEQGDYSKAILLFKATAEKLNYLYSEKATWYLILTYLQTDQIENARSLVKEIANDDGHSYQEQARDLLTRL